MRTHPLTRESPLRIAFFGSGEFALPVVKRLARLDDIGDIGTLVGLYTRPPRRAGRGKRLRPTPVAELATRLDLDVEAPETVNAPEVLDALAQRTPDLLIVADYGEFLGKRFRELPSIGSFNLHGSLLPRHRGAAPVVYSLLAGESTTGVTLFRIVRTLDGGPIVSTRALAIEPDETAGELEPRLAEVAADLLIETLPSFADGTFEEKEQDPERVTLAPKLNKAQAEIDWHASAVDITNACRAYNPWPGAYSFLERSGKPPERTTFLRVRPAPATGGPPGSVIHADKGGLVIACGKGAVEVLQVQRAGKAPLGAAEFLRGSRVEPGSRFVHGERSSIQTPSGQDPS